MDNTFTEQIKEWLETPAEDRDLKAGALYLLKLSGNKVMHANIMRNPQKYAQIIDHQLQKYYNFRVQALTHAQVQVMEEQAKAIVAEHISLATKADAAPQKGKRHDHDSLPDEIKAKYVENLSLLQRMRELHLKLRSLSTEDSPCPDSERYPFLKELISLDKKLHANWEAYDLYIITPPPP